MTRHTLPCLDYVNFHHHHHLLSSQFQLLSVDQFDRCFLPTSLTTSSLVVSMIPIQMVSLSCTAQQPLVTHKSLARLFVHPIKEAHSDTSASKQGQIVIVATVSSIPLLKAPVNAVQRVLVTRPNSVGVHLIVFLFGRTQTGLGYVSFPTDFIGFLSEHLYTRDSTQKECLPTANIIS